jgi:hypothetical protein
MVSNKLVPFLACTLALSACLLSSQQARAQAPAPAAKAPAAAVKAPPEDHRPFGKYLVKVCELGRGCYDPTELCKNNSCGPKKIADPKHPPQGCTFCDSSKPAQTITIKQVGCGSAACVGKAQYPLKNEDNFFLQASTDAKDASDNALPVSLSVDGPATEVAVDGDIHTYHVTGTETITIKATQSGKKNASEVATHLPAPTVSITLAVGEGANPDCFGLNTAPVVTTDQPDIAQIAMLAGNPVPFMLMTQGTGTILIYATRWPYDVVPAEVSLLKQVVETLNGPLGSDPTKSFGVKPATPKAVAAFTQELRIAHSAALGDPAARITALGYKITAQNIGSTPGKVRITSTDTPSCKDWTTFLAAVRDLEWSLESEPQVTKLWHLSSDDVQKAMSTLFPPPAAANPQTPSGPNTATPPAAASPNATVSVSQPPGSKVEVKTDTTPCVEAGLAFGNSNACSPPAATPAAPGTTGSSGISGTNPIPAAKPIATASIGAPIGTPPAGQLPTNPNDLLIYGNPLPGDDAQIAERNRILAQLDLPRPEMIINAWVIQNSSTDPRAMGEFSGDVRTMVERYNESLEKMLLTAYQKVSGRMIEPDYYNEAFYHYISDRFVGEGGDNGSQTSKISAQDYLDRSPAQLKENDDVRTNRLGICAKGRYCLGYSAMFQPTKPRLTDLLLALIAAKEPFNEALDTVSKVQEQAPSCCLAVEKKQKKTKEPKVQQTCLNCSILDSRANIPEFDCESLTGEQRAHCAALRKNLSIGPVKNYLDTESDCTSVDQWGILRAQFTGLAPDAGPHPPRFHLVCFARAAQLYLTDAGLARAAVADFLFQYKRSQQYPHEFSAYSLSQAAANLNSALSPMIEAFNRDVVAFQTYMRTDIEYEVEMANRGHDQRCCVKRLFGIDKPSFFNDGIISVRTISGQSAQANATSQTFLDASQAPSLSDLISAMGGASSNSALASVLGSASAQAPVSLLGSVLNSYQKTYAQIGRQLTLQAVPRSLATGSSAEISVYMKAGDPVSQPPLFSGGPASAQKQNLSEVASHDVTTRIRIDSVKLFELSSYSAVLERSRSKFPLLPPFVEIPYIGTLAGIPLAAAKEYHASTAIISAMVVPTASDIGYGLRFGDDLVIYAPAGPCSVTNNTAAPCQMRRALSFSDLHASVSAYHNAMLLCLTTERAPGRDAASLPPAISTGRYNFMKSPSAPEAPKEPQPPAAAVNAQVSNAQASSPACKDLTFSQLPSSR